MTAAVPRICPCASRPCAILWIFRISRLSLPRSPCYSFAGTRTAFSLRVMPARLSRRCTRYTTEYSPKSLPDRPLRPRSSMEVIIAAKKSRLQSRISLPGDCSLENDSCVWISRSCPILPVSPCSEVRATSSLSSLSDRLQRICRI